MSKLVHALLNMGIVAALVVIIYVITAALSS